MLFKRANKLPKLIDKSDRKYFIILLILILIAAGLETLSVGLIIPILKLVTTSDYIVPNYPLINSIDFSQFTEQQRLFLFVGIFFVAYSIKSIFLTYVSFKENNFLARIRYNLLKKIFKIYLLKPFNYFLQNNSYISTRNLLDVNKFSAVMRAISMLLAESVIMIFLIVLMIFFEPVGAIITILFFAFFGFLFQSKIHLHTKNWGRIRQVHDGYMLDNIKKSFGAIKEIKMFAKEERFIEEFSNNVKKSTDAERKNQFVYSLPRIWFEWITILGMVILLTTLLFLNNENAELLQTVGLFALIAFRLIPSTVRIMNSFQKIRYSSPVIDTLTLFLIESEKEEKLFSNVTKDNIKSLEFENSIVLNNINFTYPNTNTKVLNNVSLKINQGSTLGIIGESGSGKTTLINILLGLLKSDSGEILVDNVNINKNLKSWQKCIGYVPQNFYLLDETIKRNIAFGEVDKNIDEQKLSKAINETQLNNLVKNATFGVNTKIGEFGDRLSGGQKQRIGIARALYTNPKIIILDEPTSALDTETEKKIIDDLFLLKGQKTIILISHREKMLTNCDKILNI